jgi:hypothetical protein
VSILQPGITFLEDELKMKRHASVTVLGVITMLFSILVIVGMGAGAADEIDLWGFQLSLLLFGAVEAVVFSWIVGVDVGLKELNHGADIIIPKIFGFIMKYITPTFIIGLLILWFTIGGGKDMMFMTKLVVKDVHVLGLDMTNKTFIILLRVAFLVLLGAINLAVFTAWRYKKEPTEIEEVA